MTMFGARGWDKDWDAVIDEYVAAFPKLTEEEVREKFQTMLGEKLTSANSRMLAWAVGLSLQRSLER